MAARAQKAGKKNSPLFVMPAPWNYNPSCWEERLTIAGLALLAAAISGYMALFQFGVVSSVWDPVFGDQSRQVLLSDVSHKLHQWFRVPDALLGALGYFADAVLVLAGSTRRWQFRPWLIATFGIAVIPVGATSFILVAVQGLVLGTWCFLCLVTAILSLVLIVLALDEVISSWIFMHRLYTRADTGREVWDAFWGRPSALAREVGDEMSRRF